MNIYQLNPPPLSNNALSALEELDNLAGNLQVSSWTLVQYMNANGTYGKAGVKHYTRSQLPAVDSELGELLREELKDIEQKAECSLSYAMQRRVKMIKAHTL